jgi:2-C-methyl-D-erythritol 4-phosphate cytidylyltransferase
MKMSEIQFWAVIPAAGSGTRMKQSIPKQYLNLNGRPVIDYTLALFYHLPQIEGIVVAGDPSDPRLLSAIEPYRDRVVLAPGGETRAESVANGLRQLESKLTEVSDCWVLVHDAARPCLTQNDLKALMDSRSQYQDGALLVAPVADTLKQCHQLRVIRTHNRDEYALALTPQMAPLQKLQQALALALERGIQVTDEAQALELAGYSVGTVIGRRDNIKITYPEDLALASFFLSQQEQQ